MNPDTIKNLQQAGAWLRDAAQSLATEASIRQTRLNEVLASDPFSVTGDSHFEDWRSLARLAQTVKNMEEQLKQVYHAAMGVGGDKPFGEVPLLASSPAQQPDVVDVPARKLTRTARPRTATIASPSEPSSVGLKGNASKAYAFIKTNVGDDGIVRAKKVEIARGAAIAEGSVSAAIASLKDKGLVQEHARGQYRLV
jgi:hypothetical protein